MRTPLAALVVLLCSISLACGSGGSNGGGGGGGGLLGGAADGGTGPTADAGTGGGGSPDAGTGGGSPDAGTGGGGGGGGGDLGAFCNGLSDALRAVYTQCLKATPAVINVYAPALGPDLCSSLRLASSGGRIHVDSGKVSACISSFQSAATSCTDLDSFFSASSCQSAITGTVANGGACYTDIDCAAGTCDTSAAACPGTCFAFVAAGQACGGPNATCAPGLACDGATPVCKLRSTAGGACPCLPGNFCDGASATCMAKRSTGPCANTEQCTLSSACVQSQCAPYVGVGSACTPGATPSEPAGCGIGSYCESGTSKCIAWPVFGESCAAFPVCLGGFCDGATKVCTAPRPAGATCASPLECQKGNYCDIAGDKTCKAEKAIGAACSLAFECQSSSCKASVCVAETVRCAER